jgi:predicted dehydrogenase
MIKAQDYAAEWEIPNAYDSYQALLDDAEIDVVYNSLPNHLHAEWTVNALESDKHVLCEKPLAISLQEVDQMRAAAANHERVLAEAFMYRHHPQTILVKEMVDTGEIGEVRVIKGAFSYNLTNSGDVRLKPEMGGGSLWDVGCYPVSYARYILGNEPLEAFGWGTFGESGVDEVFVGQLRFADDVFVQFDCGFRSLPRSRIVIIGSRATLTVPTPFKPGTVPGQELYIGEVEDMTDAILSGKQPRISLEDSRNNVAVILALLQSAQEGRSVSLD